MEYFQWWLTGMKLVSLSKRMRIASKYRCVAFAIVIMFTVFNVGIPIVIASCSMAGVMRGGSCPMCDRDELPSGASVKTENKACCTATVVADRNTTEFVPEKTSFNSLAAVICHVIALLPASRNVFASSLAVEISSSPPHTVDIPVFNSSLLV